MMKSTVVDESLSSTQLQFCSRENQLATNYTDELCENISFQDSDLSWVVQEN